MIELSQAELKLTIDILQSELDQLDPDVDRIPEELPIVIGKLLVALVKPPATADLFGIERSEGG